MSEINDTIWKIHKNLTPMTVMWGTWIYDTWWKRFRGFLITGKWPKKKYIKGILDKFRDDPDYGRIDWLEERKNHD